MGLLSRGAFTARLDNYKQYIGSLPDQLEELRLVNKNLNGQAGIPFGSAVDEMLQHSHRARESTKELVRLLLQAATPDAQTSGKLVPKAPAASETGTGFHNRSAAAHHGNFNKSSRQPPAIEAKTSD
ncbi:UNVERIFIED_CONTAM: hypothetical protein FKN15_056596 [Acipenser sinensis]